jgi:hypothetical protein
LKEDIILQTCPAVSGNFVRKGVLIALHATNYGAILNHIANVKNGENIDSLLLVIQTENPKYEE